MMIAFRKGADDWLGRLIQLRTGSVYSHCEIVLGGRLGGMATLFGSRKATGTGTRRAVLKLDDWDVADVAIDDGWLQAVIAAETGKRYDTFGMLAWGTPFAATAFKDRWFCSELVAHVLRLPSPWKYSPGSIYKSAQQWID